MSYFTSQICNSVAPYRDVRCIRFGILSPDEIKRMSVTESSIIYTDLYEAGTKTAKLQGLSDPRQGPADRHSKCLTCTGSYTECPGHFGHIELVKPVYHVAFLPKILKVLRCICFHCSKLLIDPNDREIIEIVKKTKNQQHQRLAHIVDACKHKKKRPKSVQEITDQDDNIISKQYCCCGRAQPIYRRSGLGLTMRWKDENDRQQRTNTKLTAARVLEIFKPISATACEILGMDPQQSRPEWMILSVLPVPPMCVRPSVLLFGESSGQDDLTYNLANIIKANNILKEDELRDASPHIIDEHWEHLQFCCATLINNDISSIPKMTHKNGRPLKSLTERLKGKEGRVRGNLMGKRVDFSARSVITGDPNLAIDQVGVPQSIAQNLTVPEIVTPYNIEWLHEMISRRAAKYLIFENGDRIDLKIHPSPSDITLQYGCIVERQMIDDDLVVFNRQPSLHKMSMMAHRVKILPWSTFRLNLSVTTPYNADFDGDEMNLHLPQTLEAKAELSELMMVPRLLITPQSNRPIMGIVQDTLTAVTKMTRRDVFIDKNDMMNILMYIPSWDGQIPKPAIIKPKPLWTGKQLISLLLPQEINCVRGKHSESFEWISSNDKEVLVENGQLLFGILCKQTLGTSAGSLGHIIFMECGHKIAAKFYSNIQLLVNNWLLIEGHSVGISDTIIDENVNEIIHETIEQSEYEVEQIIKNVRNKSITVSSRQSLENLINKRLNKIRDTVGSFVQQSLTDFNQLKAMVESGAKGTHINISQIAACVGQQNVEGKRIPFGFKQRALPHFFKDDYGAKAGGFVKSSYLQGLTPAEFFFHAVGGREGLIDTAIKTADTGYIQRRLVKSIESIMVKYDGTVRNQNEQLIQFIYGEDGLAGENVEFQNIISLTPSDRKFQELFKFDLPDQKEDLHQFLNSNVINDLFSNDQSLEILNNEWDQLCQDRQILRQEILHGDNSRVVLPCNIQRLIYNARKLFHISDQTQSNLSPIKIIDDLKNVIQRLIIVKGTDQISQIAQHSATLLMSILLRSSLCSQQILKKHHLTSEAFDWLCEEIVTRFQQAQVHPSEMVGVLAAQSIGEPATQMTLNTFHYAGVSAKNITLGVPRLKEILNLSKDLNTPSMTIFLNNQFGEDPHHCLQVLSNLERCTLKDIVINLSIHYDPDLQHTTIDEDQEWVNVYYEILTENLSHMSPWLLRIEVDRHELNQKFLTMEQIAQKITNTFDGDLNVIYSDDNADKLIVRIRIVNRDKLIMHDENTSEENISKRMDDDTFLRLLYDIELSKILLKGINSISKVNLVETNKFLTDNSKKQFIISDEGSIKPSNEYCVITNGTALQDVLTTKDVNYRRTFTNDIVETFHVLGIEAVRKTLEYELKQVLSFDGSYVNHRHLSLLCDVMTTKGYLIPMTRHGIKRQDYSTIMRSTFEETVSVFVEAAAHAEFDPLKGVSESIALGQLAKMGTGAFDLLVNTETCFSAMPVDLDTFAEYEKPCLVPTTPWIQPMTTPSYGTITSPLITTSKSNTKSGYNFTLPTYSSTQSDYTPTTTSSYCSLTSPSYNSITSPVYSIGKMSPFYASTTPAYHPTSPSPRSPYVNPSYSPTSPAIPYYSRSSPTYSTISPQLNYYSVRSPMYSPTSPRMFPYSQASPIYRPNVASPHNSQSSNNDEYPDMDD